MITFRRPKKFNLTIVIKNTNKYQVIVAIIALPNTGNIHNYQILILGFFYPLVSKLIYKLDRSRLGIGCFSAVLVVLHCLMLTVRNAFTQHSSDKVKSIWASAACFILALEGQNIRMSDERKLESEKTESL